MANYSVNTNRPGAKKVFTSEPAAVVGSSTIIPCFIVAMSSLQDSLDGYVLATTNTNPLQVKFNTPVALDAGELVGQYAFVSGLNESRLIVGSTSAAVAASVTLTVSTAYSSAPTAGQSVNVRRWENFYLPSLHSTLQDFAERYVDKDVSGRYIWTNQENAYHTINEFKKNGGSLFYACVVPNSTDSTAELAANLSVANNSSFVARMLELSPSPEILCCPKQPSHSVSLSASEWATVDGNLIDWVESRATDDLVDDSLTEMVVITDSPSASASAAVTYRNSDLNSTSERASLCHGQYNVPSLTAGLTQAVSPAPYVCAIVNSVSTSAPESFGHAFEGSNYTQLGSNLGLVESVSPSNKQALVAAGVNPLVSKKGRGTWIESQWTQAKSSSDTGSDPLEHLHVVITRSKIWNSVQPILDSIQAEPNTAVVRQRALAQIDALMTQLQSQNAIVSYELSDVTSAVDITSGIARFELNVVCAREIDFIELKLSARLGG